MMQHRSNKARAFVSCFLLTSEDGALFRELEVKPPEQNGEMLVTDPKKDSEL
jgi:hypothetical protein